MLKKLIPTLMTFIVLFNVFFPSRGYCDDEFGYGSKITMDEATIDQKTFENDQESGSSSIGSGTGKEKGYDITDSTTNSIAKNLVKIFNMLPTLVRGCLTIITYDESDKENNKKYGTAFTIQKAVFNRVGLLDVNFFDRSNDGEIQKAIKDQIAKWYYALRNIAIVVSLLVLIYTGVRMAMSTLADSKAKYKHMLMDWFASFAILILMPYLMVGINMLSETAVDLCETMLTSMFEDDDETKIEEKLLDKSLNSTEKGWSIFIPCIIYWMLTFYQLKFFIIYGKRLMITGILVVISPLITVFYAVDKAGDGEAQSMKTWFAEYAMNVFIQPLHAMVYMIFMAMACHIMDAAPLLSVIFLSSLTRVERIARSVFRLEKGMSTGAMQDTLKFKNLGGKK